MFTREDIIIEARIWLETKFRYQGRVKKNINNKGGVDCLGFVLGVCDKLDYRYNERLLSSYDDIVYSKKPDFNLLRERFSLYFKVKNIENIGVGDIVLKQVSNEQCHLMFYTGNSFIHSSAITFSVVEHGVDDLENCVVFSMFK